MSLSELKIGHSMSSTALAADYMETKQYRDIATNTDHCEEVNAASKYSEIKERHFKLLERFASVSERCLKLVDEVGERDNRIAHLKRLVQIYTVATPVEMVSKHETQETSDNNAWTSGENPLFSTKLEGSVARFCAHQEDDEGVWV